VLEPAALPPRLRVGYRADTQDRGTAAGRQEDVVQKLIQGVHRFQDGVFRTRRDEFVRLAGSQNPEVLFVTCSDSRIDPALITQTNPGELFVLRNAGNIVPAYDDLSGGERASIEFAVRKLPIRDLVICGHSNCGAMAGLLDPGALKQLPAVRDWLAHCGQTRTVVLGGYHHLFGAELVDACIQENVLVQLENIQTHPAVAEALAAGRLKLHGWVYQIDTGEVFAYRPETGQFVPLAGAGDAERLSRK
jgi:carbonic anhydrase